MSGSRDYKEMAPVPTEEVGSASRAVKEESFAILSTDAYDAVVGAAFGAVDIVLPSSDGTNTDDTGTMGQRQSIRLHPAFIFLFCLTLFSIQLSCLSCLVLDLDLNRLWGEGEWGEFDHSHEQQMRVAMKTIMTAVLQMISVKELLGAMKPLCLVCNPISWFELQRPPHGWDGNGWMFSAKICAPICIAAQIMQFGVVYYVLIISMSVIMYADNVKDVIFNGLVVLFLAELDEVAWKAMSAIFNMDQKKFESFEFTLAQSPAAHKARAAEWRNKAKHTWKFWFYRGEGGKASVFENLVVFLALTFIYIRQLFMYIQALNTGILPVTRDVCSIYRGLKDPAEEWSSALALKIIDFFTLIDYQGMLEHTVEKATNLDTACMSAEYKAGPFDHAAVYIDWWPKNVLAGIIGIVFMFAIPQLLLANSKKILKFLPKQAEYRQSQQ